MPNMYSIESIKAAARQRGRSEEEIDRMIAGISKLQQHGLVKTSGQGASVGLTRAGARQVAQLRATDQLPPR